jgi:hypothetical protein
VKACERRKALLSDAPTKRLEDDQRLTEWLRALIERLAPSALQARTTQPSRQSALYTAYDTLETGGSATSASTSSAPGRDREVPPRPALPPSAPVYHPHALQNMPTRR